MIFPLLFDAGLIIPLLGLTGVSLSIISSTTPILFVHQLIFFIIGFFLFVIVASVDFRLWPKFIWIFYFISLVLLGISFISPEIRGSSRWVDIGWFRLQPSEIIKPLVIIIISTTIVRQKTKSFYKLIIPSLVLLPLIALIFKQPDLGNVLVYLFGFIVLEIMSGLSLSYIITGTFLAVSILPTVWFILKQYQRLRILSFLNPTADPIGAGYNAIQAMVAIGSGQFFGLGLGRGTQSHLLFLPEYHTDFVFASLGEELGFVGGAVVILFYFILLIRILQISIATKDEFGKLLIWGITAQLFIHVFINMGMNLGLLPITGITLPLLSYGGSSIVSTFIGLGLVASVARISKHRSPIVIR